MKDWKPSPGEIVEQLVMQWLNQFDPNWEEDLIMPGLDYLNRLPLEIKMVPVFREIEHNMIKGGWPQFLWNCFGNWREFIAIGKQGSLLFAEELTPTTLATFNQLYRLCELVESDCEHALLAEGYNDNYSAFATFVAQCDMTYGSHLEYNLWPGSSLYWKRITWLNEHADDTRKLIDNL
jgi:hypothetical protein